MKHEHDGITWNQQTDSPQYVYMSCQPLIRNRFSHCSILVSAMPLLNNCLQTLHWLRPQITYCSYVGKAAPHISHSESSNLWSVVDSNRFHILQRGHFVLDSLYSRRRPRNYSAHTYIYIYIWILYAPSIDPILLPIYLYVQTSNNWPIWSKHLS